MKLFKPAESLRSELKNMVNFVVTENNLGGGKPPRVLSSDYTTCAMLRAVDGVVRDGTHRQRRVNLPRYRGSGHAVCWPLLPLSLGKQGRIILE